MVTSVMLRNKANFFVMIEFKKQNNENEKRKKKKDLKLLVKTHLFKGKLQHN